MSDFAQSGLISTLQRLNDAHLPQLELELEELAHEKPIVLVLPCHGADLGRPALEHIRAELAEAHWLKRIIVSVNGADANAIEAARESFAKLPQTVRLLQTDAPQLAPALGALLGCAEDDIPHGKGLNVWAAFACAQTQADVAILATQDCDVTSFARSNLARLCYACAHPAMGFGFAKMYYSRVTDRLYGRVSRLFLAPLLQAVLRLSGHQPLLDFLLSFRYPLAGECALTRNVAAQMPLDPGWGLEIGMLCELFRREDPRSICQVDGGSGYNHKHQAAATSLAGMCGEIARGLFDHLITEGVDPAALHPEIITEAYRREAAVALRRSAKLALINGLSFDEQEEAKTVAAFAEELNLAPRPIRKPLPAAGPLLKQQAEAILRLANNAREC